MVISDVVWNVEFHDYLPFSCWGLICLELAQVLRILSHCCELKCADSLLCLEGILATYWLCVLHSAFLYAIILAFQKNWLWYWYCIYGWVFCYLSLSIFWPVVSLYVSQHLLKIEAFLMRVEKCINLNHLNLIVSLFCRITPVGSLLWPMTYIITSPWPANYIKHGFLLMKQDLNPIRK